MLVYKLLQKDDKNQCFIFDWCPGEDQRLCRVVNHIDQGAGAYRAIEPQKEFGARPAPVR
jgi:hypothetical protein